MQNQRNLIWTAVLTGLLLLAWDAGTRYFYPNAGRTKPVAAAPSAEPSAKATPTREGGLTTPDEIAQEARSLPAALSGGRVPIEAPRVKGSIALTGGMVDDTAEELDRDLGAGLEPAPSQQTGSADDRKDLVRRIEALERHAFRQEQAFKRVMDLMEANATGRPV